MSGTRDPAESGEVQINVREYHDGQSPVWIASAGTHPPVGSTVSASAATLELRRAMAGQSRRGGRAEGLIRRAGTASYDGRSVGEVHILQRPAGPDGASVGYLRFLDVRDQELLERLQRVCDVVGSRDARRRLREQGLRPVELEIDFGGGHQRELVHVGSPIAAGERVLTAMFTLT